MKSIGLRKAIELFGGTDIEISKGYHFQSGFFNKDGQLYYINADDNYGNLRNGQLDVYYRTAEHRKDYHGGLNCFDFLSKINNMGYILNKFPKTKVQM